MWGWNQPPLLQWSLCFPPSLPGPEKLNLNIVKRKYGLQSQRNIRDNTRILTFGKNAIFGVEKWGSLHLINSLHWNNRQDWVVPADPPPRHNIRYKYKKERKIQGNIRCGFLLWLWWRSRPHYILPEKEVVHPVLPFAFMVMVMVSTTGGAIIQRGG